MHCLWWNKSVSIWPPCASISSHWTSQSDLGSVSEILFSTWKNYHQTVRVVIFTLILKIIQVRSVSKHQGEERRKHRYRNETQHDPNQEWIRLSAGQTIQDDITPAQPQHHHHRQSQRQNNASSTPPPNSTKKLALLTVLSCAVLFCWTKRSSFGNLVTRSATTQKGLELELESFIFHCYWLQLLLRKIN